MKKILLMCVANSARSQMAEGLGKTILAGIAEVRSAGSHPTTVNPYAIAALREVGIGTEGQHSKSVDALSSEFLRDLDFVITLCAEEVCPIVLTSAMRLHWPLPDPAGFSGTDEEQMERFRRTRDQIAKWLAVFRESLGVDLK